MFEKNIVFEVVLKYVILVLLFIVLTILLVSGIMFLQGNFTETNMNLHMVSGATLVVLAIVHSYIKRKKIKKLTHELKNIINGVPVQMDCNTTRFINALKDVSVSELSSQFNADAAKILNESDIKVKSGSEKLGQVCKNNDEKMFYVFVVLMEGIFSKKDVINLDKERVCK
ncbi:MAG: chemotaxis protein [Campylobacter sp.]|nr:chemotaxis protein [Campylobacter sp.]